MSTGLRMQTHRHPLIAPRGARCATTLPAACAGGLIYVVEKGTYDILASYKIKKILFCTKGDSATGDDNCMAFTFHTTEVHTATSARAAGSTGPEAAAGEATTGAPADFMCHAFQFASADKTEQALKYIAQAFGNHSRVQHIRRRGAGGGGGGGGGGAEESMTDALHYTFDLALSTAERDAGKMTYVPCVYTRDTFKVKSLDDPLQFSVTLTQTSVQPMLVEQGFGLLVGLGQADPSYSAIQMLSCKPSGDKALVIVGTWSPPPNILAEASSDGETLALSMAVDVALTGVTEPLRIELKVAFRLVRHLDRVSFLRRATGTSHVCSGVCCVGVGALVRAYGCLSVWVDVGALVRVYGCLSVYLSAGVGASVYTYGSLPVYICVGVGALMRTYGCLSVCICVGMGASVCTHRSLSVCICVGVGKLIHTYGCLAVWVGVGALVRVYGCMGVSMNVYVWVGGCIGGGLRMGVSLCVYG